MKLICLVRRCAWSHLFNTQEARIDGFVDSVGIYQCSRCGALSVGAWRDRSIERDATFLDTDFPDTEPVDNSESSCHNVTVNQPSSERTLTSHGTS